MALVVVNVDDILITDSNLESIRSINKSLEQRFTVRTCNDAKTFLGISIVDGKGTIKLHHKGMIERMLKCFEMTDCTISAVTLPKGTDLYASVSESTLLKNVSPYQQLVGALLHLSNTTRPDIYYATSYLARNMQNPTIACWNTAEPVLRYLKGTSDFGIRYSRIGPVNVAGYSDSDWGQEKPDRKSIGGYTFIFAGGAISWKSKKQSVVAQSTVEAEYIAVSDSVKEALWIRNFKEPFGIPRELFAISIGEGNQGCIAISDKHIVNERSKQVDGRYQMVLDNVRRGII